MSDQSIVGQQAGQNNPATAGFVTDSVSFRRALATATARLVDC
jgi:hypothetical protein